MARGRGTVPRWLRVVVVVVLALVALSGTIAAAAVTTGDPAVDGAEQAFAARINQERSARGLGPLTSADDLVAVARRHAREMAAQGRIYHNPELPAEVEGWQALGENVGRGDDVQAIHTAFMASDIHRKEIIGARFTQVGVGVAITTQGIWVTQVFRQPLAAATAPAPAPPAAPRPAPAPVPARPLAATPVVAPPVAVTPPAPTLQPLVTLPPTTVPRPVLTSSVPVAPAAPEMALPDRPGSVLAASAGLALPAPVAAIPTAAAVAAALLVAVVGLQGLAVRRLRLA